MVPQAQPMLSPPPRASFRQLWANGWGARLILAGSLLSLPSLFATWGMIVSDSGHGEYRYRGGGTTERMHPGWTTQTYVPGTTLDPGSAFSHDFVGACIFAGLIVLSVYVAVRPVRPDQTWIRWVPLVCTAVLVLNGTNSALEAVRDSESYMAGSPVEIHAGQGIGPFWLVACQILAALGGFLFLRGKPAPKR